MALSATLERLPIDYDGPIDRPFEFFPSSVLESSVIDRFAAIANRFPARLAIEDAAVSLSYADLASFSALIARAISAMAEERVGPVAILLPAEARFPAAMLGILGAGRGYVPLDSSFPVERNRLIASHAGVVAVVSAGDLARQARLLFPQQVPILDLDALTPGEGQAMPAFQPAGPDDLAYIIYTSGSTGVPKGVYQNNRNLLHDVMQYTNALHLDCEDRLTLLYSPSVAGAIPDIYGALLNGASLHVLPPRDLQPTGLVREIRDRGITIYHSVPTLARRVVEALGPDERFDTVRLAYFSGDRVDWKDVDVFRRGFPSEAFLYLALNSTESARTYCHWFMDESLRGTSNRLPVGRAIPDRNLSIVDADGRAVAEGEVGEFMLESRYIALGYWRAPELMEQAFSLAEDGKSRRLRTGDLGVVRPDGLYEYRGRKDQRIKLRGHSIEPAEIEIALNSCPGVREGTVVIRSDTAGEPRSLVAYVELDPGTCGLLPRHITAMLARALPAYMIPSAVFVQDELPRLANFKIDRLRLGEADAARVTNLAERENDPLLDQIARIYEETLEVDGATADDTLNSLGGDSLQVLNLALEFERHFEVEIPTDMLEEAAIRDLARWVAARRAA